MALSSYTRETIAELNASLNSTIQLNSSKVPAQEGVFSLIISSGGTGLDALLETKGLINKTCCQDDQHKDQPTDHVAYLAFDTDSASRERTSSRETGGARLDIGAGEYVQMEAPNIATFLSPAYRSQVPSYISSWLDFSINPNHTGTNGAGGIRQCGRLLMFQNIDRIRASIDGTIRRMVAGQNVSALNVYLLAGISGGTGSGTFVDLAYIAQNVAEAIAGARVSMYGYLFMPDVNLCRPMPQQNKDYISKNGYAALKELDYLMNMDGDKGRFVQRYGPNYVIDTSLSPFKYVHLVSSMGANGYVPGDPYRHGMRAVAQSIVSFVAQEQKGGVTTEFVMQSHYDNIKQGTEQHPRKFPERHNSYLALGTYSYELPVDQILLYVTSLLFEKMNRMFDNEPSREDVSRAYSALGLSPQALLSSLTGNSASIAPPNVTFDDLFGKNARYNLSSMCDNWIDRTTVDIENRGHIFLKEFRERFVKTAETWFTDPNRGPIWVNHLIVRNSENTKGLDARLGEDYGIAGSQATAIKTQIEQVGSELAGKAGDAQQVKGRGKRAEFAGRYVDEINRYANLHAKLVAMKQMQEIYKECREVVREENNKFFDIVVEILLALKAVCEENANILTRAQRNVTGTHFTWQPLSIPDVSDAIRQAFDSKGDTAQTIANFCRAIYAQAYRWSRENADVKSFVQDYLDENLSDIANKSLEDYVRVVLRGADLKTSVITSLGPAATTASVPLISLSQNADRGGQFWLLSVPFRCQEILEGFREYAASVPSMAGTLTIQPSGINNRIFAQSVLSAVPLSSYAPLAEYEKVYLNQFGDSGKHLYMGEKENWAELPCPIPYRSRPQQEGAYPPAIREQEDRWRELFRQCRTESGGFPIIRRDDHSAQTYYQLHVAALPDLEEHFALSAMRDESGRMDSLRLQEALETLNGWLTHGLPDQAKTDEVHDSCYLVTVCAIPTGDQPDSREMDAREAFIGEYNNLRRAREEVEKYRKTARKRDELKAVYDQTVGAANRALQTIRLLISGVVRFARDEEGNAFYRYVLNGKERELLRLEETENRREAELSRRIASFASDPEPLRRQLGEELVKTAQRRYEQQNADAETQEEKLRKLKSLLGGVETRCDRLREDLMNGTADPGVDRDMVTFYERMISRLTREIRDAQDRLDRRDSGAAEEF